MMRFVLMMIISMMMDFTLKTMKLYPKVPDLDLQLK